MSSLRLWIFALTGLLVKGEKSLGFRGLGFRGLGFRGLGFRVQDLGFKVGVQGYLSFDLKLNDDNTLDTWLYWMSECPDYGLVWGP